LTESRDSKERIERASLSADYDRVSTGVIHCRTRSRLQEIRAGLIDPHQILYHEGRLYVCNSGRGNLEMFQCSQTPSQNEWTCHILVESGYDCVNGVWCGEHINSIFIDTRVHYMRHRFGRSAVSVLEESITCDDHVIEQSHNIACLAANYYVCNSAGNSLYNLTRGCNVWQSPIENGFTRGLACVADEVMVIGISVYEPDRSRRNRNTGYLAVVQRSTANAWTTLNLISLPESGDVYDIRAIDFPDRYSHNGYVMGSDRLLGMFC